MHNRKILIVAIVLGVIAVVLLNMYVLRERGGEPIVLLKARQDIPAGRQIKSSDYEEIRVPGSYSSLSRIAVTRADASLLSHTATARAVKTGDIILLSHLNRAMDQGLYELIEPGKKAVSIPVNEVSSVSYFVKPGDLVDVFGTFVSEGGKGITTKPILQAVKVLAVGDQYQRGEGSVVERQSYSAVTLLLSLEQAEKLIHFRDVGGRNLTLALRNPKDTEKNLDAPGVEFGSDQYDKIQ